MFKGKNIHIRTLNTEDAVAMLKLERENRDFFESFSKDRSNKFYTMEDQLDRIKMFVKDRKHDQNYNFGIFENGKNSLVGTIKLFQILRGPLQSGFIGYYIDKSFNGKGYATEATKLIVEYAFNVLQLHRLEACVMPHNTGSIRVLEKSGFHKEGIAKKNAKINGHWEDHQVLAIINPKH